MQHRHGVLALCALTLIAVVSLADGKAVQQAASAAPEQSYEQQILVVKGNPSPEKLNEEIRKAIRSLLGSDEGVDIKELKNVEELRKVVPPTRAAPPKKER